MQHFHAFCMYSKPFPWRCFRGKCRKALPGRASKPRLRLDPTWLFIEIRQLGYAAMLLSYEAMPGVDFSGPDSDIAGAESLASRFVSHLAPRAPGTANQIVENLAKMGITVQLTTADGKTTQAKTSQRDRELSSNHDQPGPIGSEITTVTITVGGRPLDTRSRL